LLGWQNRFLEIPGITQFSAAGCKRYGWGRPGDCASRIAIRLITFWSPTAKVFDLTLVTADERLLNTPDISIPANLAGKRTGAALEGSHLRTTQLRANLQT